MAKKRGEPPSERKARAKAKAAAEQAEGARLARLEMACETYGPPNPDAGRIAADEAQATLQRELESLRAEWQREGNPLFVWQAIARCNRHALDRAGDEARAAGASVEDECRARMAAVPSHLPGWVLRYLGSVAHALHNLTFGRDWRTFHEIPDEGWSKHEREAVRAWLDGSLDPEEAARLVPWALGVTRPGFNAFRDFIAQDRAKWLAADMSRLRAEGLSAEEAAEILAQREGYGDPRSVKRIVSKARRRVAKPTG